MLLLLDSTAKEDVIFCAARTLANVDAVCIEGMALDTALLVSELDISSFFSSG